LPVRPLPRLKISDIYPLDNQVWALVGEGDKGAYAQLYVFYYKKLYNYGRKFTEDLALLEDALQEALLSVWTGRARLQTVQAPHTYLLNTFRYILFRKIRQASKVRTLQGEDEPEFGAEHLLVRRDMETELRQRLENAMASLTSRQREAIYLRFYEGLSYDEVAAVLGITVKATYKMVARGLLHLRQTMALPLWVLVKIFLTGVG
jgi:RNA polymerase sigma factor (sigma-70 family)